MKSGIYKIINTKGEIYIGCSINVEERIQHYKILGKINSQPFILESILKYGWDSHKFEILEYTEDLIEREKHYIKKFNSFEKGLNGNRGGGGVQTHTEETKQKISSAGLKNKGKRATSHRKEKIISEKHRLNISKAKLGQPSHRKGKNISEEHKKNISKANKGIPKTGNNKPILQYDKKGNFITEHPSIEAAAILVKGNPTAINNALRKGGNATSASYIWRYKD